MHAVDSLSSATAMFLQTAITTGHDPPHIYSSSISLKSEQYGFELESKGSITSKRPSVNHKESSYTSPTLTPPLFPSVWISY